MPLSTRELLVNGNHATIDLLTIFGVYTGLVIYFILAFANPFSGAGYVEPVRLERLYGGMLKSL